MRIFICTIFAFFAFILSFSSCGNTTSNNKKVESIDSIASEELTQKVEKPCPVGITLHADGPSCVNGYDVYATFTNNTDKEIKYISMNVVGHNRVGDIVESEYGGWCKWTGPLAPNKTACSNSFWTLYFELNMKKDGWEAIEVEVEFMDGSVWSTSNPYYE